MLANSAELHAGDMSLALTSTSHKATKYSNYINEIMKTQSQNLHIEIITHNAKYYTFLSLPWHIL